MKSLSLLYTIINILLLIITSVLLFINSVAGCDGLNEMLVVNCIFLGIGGFLTSHISYMSIIQKDYKHIFEIYSLLIVITTLTMFYIYEFNKLVNKILICLA